MGRRGWLETLLGIGLGVGGLLVLGYVLIAGRLGSRPTPTAPPTQAPVALWEAYEQARAAAEARAADAALVSASAQWEAVSEEALASGAGYWTFVFYSPAGGSLLDVVVGEQEAQVVNQTPARRPPAVLSEGRWRDGPRDALVIFRAYTGDFMRQHPWAVVDLHLGAGESGAPVWSVAALDAGAGSALAVVIDVETNQVLSVTP